MAHNDQDYAVVVGINAYPQLRVLRAAVGDATKFAEWLQLPNGGGLPEKNVRLIVSAETLPTEPLDAKPIQEDIDKALRDFGVEKNQWMGRRLYFYFTGHGIGPNFNNVGMLMAHAAMVRLNYNIGLQNYLDYFHEHVLVRRAGLHPGLLSGPRPHRHYHRASLHAAERPAWERREVGRAGGSLRREGVRADPDRCA